ncbi:MAG: ATPase [Spirulina sp. SIO3F2]|nr:ATPase [Spirulina sp. SIO3F2]
MASPLIKRFQVSLAHNKLYGLATSFFVLIVSGVVALIPPAPPPPDQYRAIGLLAYNAPPPTVTETGQAIFQQGQSNVGSKESLLTERVVVKVAQAFERKDIRKFLKSIEIKLPKEEDKPKLIKVIYTDTKEGRSGKILQMLLEEMVEQSRLVNTAQLRAQIKTLESRLEGEKRQLAQAERVFYNFLSQEGSSLAPAEDGSLFNAINTAQAQQRELRFQLEGVTAQMRSIESQLGLTPEEAAVASALSADPIIARIQAQRAQIKTEIAFNEKTLRPEHPQMVDLLGQLAALDQLLTERADEVVGTDGVFNAQPSQVHQDSSLDATRQQLANRLVGLQTQQQALSQQLAIAVQTERQLRQDYERFPAKRLEQERLQQELTLKKNFHDFLQAKLVDARTAEAETVGSLIIAQPANVQKQESTYSPPPGPIIIFAAGMVASVLVGLGTIFVFGFLDPHLYTAAELQTLFDDRDITVLGTLPYFDDVSPDTLPVLSGANRHYLPQYELFRSNLRRWSAQKAKVVLIASVDSEEGKSTTAYNLAIAAAAAGQRTLLIEGNLRSPSQATALGVKRDPDAPSEPLGYYGSFAASTALVPTIANLYIMPSAGPQPNAAVILESSEFRRLIANARARFDLVVVDTPALADYNDALLLQPLSDGLVIVTQPAFTHGKKTGAMLEQLIEAEVPILGGVINGDEDLEDLPMVAEPEPAKSTYPVLDRGQRDRRLTNAAQSSTKATGQPRLPLR